jgi:tetratricopeptide (TPR) repeat protein
MNLSLRPEELEAWHSFEVGSCEDVFELQRKHPENQFIEHIALLAHWQDGELDKRGLVKYNLELPTPLQHLVKAIALSVNYQVTDAWAFFQEYIKQKTTLFSSSLLKFGVGLALENFAYETCLQLIRLDKNPNKESFYAEEILVCLYNLNKHSEVIQHFKTNFKFIQETQQIYFILGMSLLAKGKYKEAEAMLRKQKKLLNLPSYDEKKQEFIDKIEKIPQLEKKTDLTAQELQDLGFAYLFTSQYKKAEEAFNRELRMLQPTS